MGSNCSKAGKCLDCASVCVVSNAIHSEDHSTTKVSSEMAKSGRAEKINGGRSEFLLLLPNRVQANEMGSNCSKAAKCPAEWYSFPMTSNVIQRRDHSTTSVSEMAKSGRAHDIKEGIPRVGTTRQEQFCELTMGRSDSSAAKISATVNQIKEERVQVSKEETALKSNVPQYSNGKSMIYFSGKR
ncbi:hypothetical protein ACROYT_G010639 [Oculina patagonica]